MTEIYLHFYSRITDYMETHPYMDLGRCVIMYVEHRDERLHAASGRPVVFLAAADSATWHRQPKSATPDHLLRPEDEQTNHTIKRPTHFKMLASAT